jgi:hypothetical protein
VWVEELLAAEPSAHEAVRPVPGPRESVGELVHHHHGHRALELQALPGRPP